MLLRMEPLRPGKDIHGTIVVVEDINVVGGVYRNIGRPYIISVIEMNSFHAQ
jgi:hypothetical protein